MAINQGPGPMPRVPQSARPNQQNITHAGRADPGDYHARIWAQYKDMPEKPACAPPPPGCVFCKPGTLPNGVVDHGNSNGFIPTDLVHIYGQLALLGSRALDTDGNLPLQTISGTTLPPAFGTLTLTGVSAAPSGGLSLGSIAASASTSAVAASLAGVVALLWPSGLGDSSLL